jgi:hypothetical protein
MVNKTISISREMFDELSKEENASALIENLLKDYFKTKSTKQKYSHLTLEQKKELIKLMEEQNALELKQREITNVSN